MPTRKPPKALLEQRPALADELDVQHPSNGVSIGDPPRKYTRAVHERICEELRKGQRAQGACARAGITTATFYEWMRRGKSGDPHLYEFYEDVEKAFNEAEAHAVDVVVGSFSQKKASDNDREAAQWFLERARAEGYSKQVKTAVEGQIRDFMMRLEASLDPASFEKVLAVYMGFSSGAQTSEMSTTGSKALEGAPKDPKDALPSQ